MERRGSVEFEAAYGLSDRRQDVRNEPNTMFAIASGTKGLTALTLMSLIEQGTLELDTTARSWLRDDLPLIHDSVTVGQLLAHRSGIGDYLDEETISSVTEYLMTVPVQQLSSTEQYLSVLEGHPMKFSPGERFSYSNSGYVVLALIAERCTGESFQDLVTKRVCGRSGMQHTAFLRSDELPGGVAIGYLEEEGLRTNVFHLPVMGSGDGGIYTTAADISSMWKAVFNGDVVSLDSVKEMTQVRSEVPSRGRSCGLGLWLTDSGEVLLVGSDAGVSFYSSHDPLTMLTKTVISNTTTGAWPMVTGLTGSS